MSISIPILRPSGAKGIEVDQLESIYRSNVRRVRWVLRSRGVDEMMLDDLVQEVFVALHRRLPRRDPAVPIPSFVAAVARNVAYSHRRAASRRREVIRRVEPPQPTEAPDVEVARRRAAAELEAFIETLPPRQREAFVLGEVLGMTVPEIQRLVRVPADTLYSRLKAARKRFASRFGPQAKCRRWARAVDRGDRNQRDRVWLAIAAGLPKSSVIAGGSIGAAGIRWGLAVAGSAVLAGGVSQMEVKTDVPVAEVVDAHPNHRRVRPPVPAAEDPIVADRTPGAVVAVVESDPPPKPRKKIGRAARKVRPPPEASAPEPLIESTATLSATVRALRDAKQRLRAGDRGGAHAVLSAVEPAPALANEWRLLMTTSSTSGAKAIDDNP